VTTLKTLYGWLDEEYAKAAGNPQVDDAAAYSSYKVWRRADAVRRKSKEKENSNG
jgi:hypothetical protein